jgi:cyanophycin synthetase
MYGRQIGMVTVPGDRRDEDIREMGEVAALTFDEVVLREDPSRRGRAEGEILELLAQGARRGGASESRIHRVADEFQAAECCMSLARPGDLVVLTPTEVEEMWAYVLAFRSASRPNFVAEVVAFERTEAGAGFGSALDREPEGLTGHA